MSDAKFTPYERKLIDELTAAKAEIEQLRGRVAELESQAQQLICSGTGPFADNADRHFSGLILRKQADAVESARDKICEFRGELWNAAQPDELTDYADRLRQKADELKRDYLA